MESRPSCVTMLGGELRAKCTRVGACGVFHQVGLAGLAVFIKVSGSTGDGRVGGIAWKRA